MRTNSRSEKMTKVLSMRLTEGDVAALKIQAQKRGIDTSQFVRQVLIEQHILKPMGDYEFNFT